MSATVLQEQDGVQLSDSGLAGSSQKPTWRILQGEEHSATNNPRSGLDAMPSEQSESATKVVSNESPCNPMVVSSEMSTSVTKTSLATQPTPAVLDDETSQRVHSNLESGRPCQNEAPELNPQNVSVPNPTDLDVVFGRGEPTRRHPGNLILREFVNRRLQEYMQTSKTNKSAIIGQVIDEIRDTGARYLVPLDASSRHAIFTSGCRMANRTEIRSKVSHAFRDGEKREQHRRKKEKYERDTSLMSKQQQAHHTMAALHSMQNTAAYGRTQSILSSVTASASHPSTLPATGGGMFEASQRREASHLHPSVPFPIHNSTVAPGNVGSGYAHTPTQSSPVIGSIDGGKSGTITLASTPSSSAEVPHIETPVPSKTKRGTGDDLLSFATILTSLRETSPQQNEQVNACPNSQQQWQGRSPGGGLLSPESSSSVAGKTPNNASRKPNGKVRSQPQNKASMGRSNGSITKNLEAHCREIDIVFGRGAPLRRHPGNIKFRKVVESFSKEYKGASKHEKTEIIRRVIEQVEEMGARFLIMEENTVKGASPDEIRMKVSHRFRDLSKGAVRKSGENKEDGGAISRRMKSTSPTSAAVAEINSGGSFVQAV